MMKKLLYFASIFLVNISIVNAQSERVEVPELISNKFKKGIDKAVFLKKVNEYIKEYGESGEYISEESIELRKKFALAKMRANTLEKFFRADINNDGKISINELYQYSMLRNGRKGYAKNKSDKMMGFFDENKDSIITFDEIIKFKNPDHYERINEKFIKISELLKIDPNSDSKLEKKELEEVSSSFFDRLDSNRDDSISNNEILKKKTILGANCGLPEINKDSLLNVVSIYGGNALSDVSLVGQDKETTATKVVIIVI